MDYSRRFDDWIPVKLGWKPGAAAGSEGATVEWCDRTGIRFTESFFADTVQRCLREPFRVLFRQETPLTAARDWHEARPGLAPAGLIFHMSRCGSTLISQMLAALARASVLSEASPIDEVLRSRWRDPAPPDDERIAWLRWIVSALAQPRHGEQHLFIKLDCWHIFDLPLILQAFPNTPWVFVYRDPIEVMVSHSRQPGQQMVSSLVSPTRFGIDPAVAPLMAREEYVARVLAAICGAAVRYASCGSGAFINYSQLPAAAWSVLPDHFGVPVSAAEADLMRAAAEPHAKQPYFLFEPDSAIKQAAATPAQRAMSDRWVRPFYERLEALRHGENVAGMALDALPVLTPEPRADEPDRAPVAPAPPVRRGVGVRCRQLPFAFDPARLRADLDLIAPDEWVPHFNQDYYEGQWSGAALRSVGGTSGQLYADPSAASQYLDTPLLARCPYFAAVLAAFQCPLESVRLLKLAARSSIREHSDYHLGYDEGVLRVHIPVQTNADVRFFLDGERVEMKMGEAWYLDLSRRHRVDNQSDTDRVHLVLDCVVNDWLDAFFNEP